MKHKYEYLVSACLCGEKVRYDGKTKTVDKIKKLVDEGKALPICPEVEGGLPVPRHPCEIKDERVINTLGEDKTHNFVKGANRTLELCNEYNIKKAILKERSPSCGSNYIYDGTFTNTLIKGQGITARLLKENGIEVISEEKF
ncbi:MAG TPA: DUF523 domain-containing protein [Tissierellia bacterium]|mgnify:CR=1 FL=1|nr:DUF523 domain-containing protein [Tissierellia bacterium]